MNTDPELHLDAPSLGMLLAHCQDPDMREAVEHAWGFALRWKWWNIAGRLMLMRRLRARVRLMRETQFRPPLKGRLRGVPSIIIRGLAAEFERRAVAIRSGLPPGADTRLLDSPPGPKDGWMELLADYPPERYDELRKLLPTECTFELLPEDYQLALLRHHMEQRQEAREALRHLPQGWRSLDASERLRMAEQLEASAAMVRTTLARPLHGAFVPGPWAYN